MRVVVVMPVLLDFGCLDTPSGGCASNGCGRGVPASVPGRCCRGVPPSVVYGSAPRGRTWTTCSQCCHPGRAVWLGIGRPARSSGPCGPCALSHGGRSDRQTVAYGPVTARGARCHESAGPCPCVAAPRCELRPVHPSAQWSCSGHLPPGLGVSSRPPATTFWLRWPPTPLHVAASIPTLVATVPMCSRRMSWHPICYNHTQSSSDGGRNHIQPGP